MKLMSWRRSRPDGTDATPSSPMKKILILTAGYGEGHNSAARALQSAFNENPAVEAELIDLFALRAPRLNNFSRRAYVKVINTAPKIWSAIYGWLDRSPLVPVTFKALGSHRELLGRLIAEKKPSAICSTYPIYAGLLNDLRHRGHQFCPHYTIITDALTINSLWFRTPSAGWFVTDPDSGAVLCTRGIPSEQVHVSGFPVALAFANRRPEWQPPELTRTTRRKILFMINSGRSHALQIARALLQHRDWEITFTAGRDLALQQELKNLATGAPAQATVLGWTNDIPQLLMTHHVVISKAGGATTQESINAHCPLLVSQIVPGQEEGNYELIRRNDAGALTETPQAIVTTLQRIFASDAAIWQHWRANLQRFAQPAAARTIATTVLSKSAEIGNP